jgi:hypothetical protein
MRPTLDVFNDAVASPDALTSSLLLAALFSVGYAFTVSRFTKSKHTDYPPLAPGGMVQHVKMMTSSHYPWWVLVSPFASARQDNYSVSISYNLLYHCRM